MTTRKKERALQMPAHNKRFCESGGSNPAAKIVQKSKHSILSELYCRTGKVVDKRIKYINICYTC